MIYPWQQQQWDNLWRDFQHNRVAHSVMLKGASGLGKNDFALAYAKLLLCDQPDERSQLSCGVCKACKLWDAKSHPDFYNITLEDKSRVIKVDQVRRLIEQLEQTSSRGHYQVVIITPAELMHVSAVNALLKTLEEPSGKVVLILVADQTQKCPPTLLSRCRQLVFQITDPTVASAWLEQQMSDVQCSQLVLRAAYGAPLLALHLSQEKFSVMRDSVLASAMDLLQQRVNPIQIVEVAVKGDVSFWLYIWLGVIEDLIKIKSNSDDRFLIHNDCINLLNKIAGSISLGALHVFLQQVIEAKKLIESASNCNVQIVIERLMLSWKSQ